MNKKIITLVAVIMAVCMMFAACGQDPAPAPEHNHTFDSTKWASDATMHWHAANCEHTTEKTDIQGHIDENIDGVCDVCAYAASHTHTFEEKWNYDATNHWHASTCFHNVTSDTAAHTADEMGFCTVCGYKVSDPVVDTVEKAIDLGVAQKDTVKHGSIFSSEGHEINYEFRNGYLYVKEGTTECFYSLTTDGLVFAAVRANAWGETTVYRDELASEENLKGAVIPNSFINNEITFYGAEDLVSYLYDMASVDNLNGDFAESVTDGVYAFSFGYYIDSYGLYQISVEFTLDETTYAIASVNLKSTHYAMENVEIATEAAGDLPATYAPKADAEATYVYTVTINQGIDAENPFNPVDMLATNFDLVDEEGNILPNTIEIGRKEDVTVYIGNLFPNTAMVEFILMEVSGENVNLEWSDPNWKNGLSAYPYDGYIQLTSSAAIGTTYTLSISVNGTVKTYTITVVEPTPTYIVGGVLGEDYGNTIMTPSNKLEMTVGDKQTIGAYLDKEAGEILVTVTPATTLDDTKFSKFSVWDDMVGGTVSGISYDLSALPAGEYTFTFTASVNAELTTSIQVTVKEKAAPPSQGGGNYVTPSGSGIQTDPFIITNSGEYKVNVVDGAAVFFAFTATEAGTINFKFTSDNGYLQAGTFSFMLCDKMTTDSLSVSINPGQTFFMKVSTYDYGSDEITFTFSAPGAPAVEEPSAPAISGTGVQTDPFIITQSGDYTANVVDGAYVYFAFTATTSGTINFKFTSANGYLQAGTYSFMLCDKMTTDTLSVSINAGQTFFMKVSTYDHGSGAITFNITVPGAPAVEEPSSPALSGSGVQADPFIITQSGTYTANVVAGADVYFAFTATTSGTIEFAFVGEGYLQAGTYSFMLCDKITFDTLTVSITAGQTFFMKVTTLEMGTTGTVTFNITVPGAAASSDPASPALVNNDAPCQIINQNEGWLYQDQQEWRKQHR